MELRVSLKLGLAHVGGAPVGQWALSEFPNDGGLILGRLLDRLDHQHSGRSGNRIKP